MPAEPDELLGTWWLHRRVADLRRGQCGRVTGTLELVLVGSAVHWLERGELAWDGAVHPVSRELHLERSESGWDVRFADGRAFHRWAPGQIVEHPCRADHYLGLIRVDRDCTRLRTLWDVSGPDKRQRIFTRAVRARAPGCRPR
jgi:hypothetical protein